MNIDQEENIIFLMSMSNTMRKLWPAPIEMDIIDEGVLKSNGRKKCLINASRWAVCADIIRLMINRINGCDVNVSIGRCSDSGVAMTNGNSNEKSQQLLDSLAQLSSITKGYEEIHLEFPIREIEKIERNGSNQKKMKQKVHWFIDVDTLVNLNCSLFDRHFPENLVTLYVIGELQTLHDDFLPAKRVTALLENLGINVKFLLCRADLNELRSEILSEKRYEMSERSAKIKIGGKKLTVQLHQVHRVGKRGFPIKRLLLVGFLPEIELCRLGFFRYKSIPEHQMSVSAVSKTSNDILWSIGNFLLSENKNYRVALLKFRRNKKKRSETKCSKKRLGYCIMTAQEDDNKETLLTLIRLPQTMSYSFAKSLQFVEKIDEPKSPLPDASYPQFATQEPRIIKRRLEEIGLNETLDSKKAKFEEISKEYNCLHARDSFVNFTSAWQKHAGLLAETKVEAETDGNNN
ncbi:hypothetical protein CAEBREN_04259 [Caenorhabditis brenneri]|uniref:Uncharacterized protein n=1 Tax=Caenorhabditis brenneri TaxID=135651 RepID=G0NME0_CAEBE|nr:hypothetical protein CAEBREN_04259 [Caenorhabditis brenneri]